MQVVFYLKFPLQKETFYYSSNMWFLCLNSPTQPVEYIDVGIPYQRIKNVLFHTADFPRSAEKCMIFVLIVHRTEKLLAWLTTIYIYFIFIFFLSFFFYYNTISPHGYLSSSQCFYHWVDTSAGGLLVLMGIYPVVSASITGSIPLLVDY